MAIDAILANKMRAFLTLLGVIIGVASVITMVSLGQGLEAAILSEISDFVSPNVMWVIPQWDPETGRRLGRLEYQDLLLIRDHVPDLIAIAPETQGRTDLRSASRSLQASIMATNADYQRIRNLELVEGRFILPDDDLTQQRVVVLGYDVWEELFDKRPVIGENLKIERMAFQVIGILEEPSGSAFIGGMGGNNQIIIPISTMNRLQGINRLDVIWMEPVHMEMISLIQEQVGELLRLRHGTAPGGGDRFRVASMEQEVEFIGQISLIITAVLAGIAAISLLVGGIGIMNIMLVSVTERTREIGIRKALGAPRYAILSQFVVEAVVLCLLGGGMGILLSVLGTRIMAIFLPVLPVISSLAVLIAFSFSALVGILFGLYPAYRASKLDPIEALRYE